MGSIFTYSIGGGQMAYTSMYGGELIRIPLNSLIKVGRGDDIHVVVDKENHTKYGCLGVGANEHDYKVAQKMASEWLTGEPIMVAAQDPESGSPMMLTREVVCNEKKHFLAIIFNARFANDSENINGSGSFLLRLSSALDPDAKVAERIIYSPGDIIEWNDEQIYKIWKQLTA